MSSENILQTFELGKRYGKRWVVEDLSLSVRRGEIFGFLGPNGAGKSTTIRMLLTLVGPTKGRVELFGKPLAENRREVLSRVGGLVERPDFYLYLSARKNLEIVAALRGGVSPAMIVRALEVVGLGERADDRVKTYSHGMKQRLGLAQALLGDPELVVLDEPTSGLDPQGMKEVRDLLTHLSTINGTTIFLSSHLLAEVGQSATHMAIINEGKLVVQGRVDDLLQSGGQLVRVVARPVETAARVIEQFTFVTGLRRIGEELEVTMPHEHIRTLNRTLVEAGIDVDALVPKRSLEEYFLAITEHASDGRTVR